MLQIKAYYQSIFELNLSDYQVSVEDGVKVIAFASEEEYNQFLSEHKLEEKTLAEGTKIVYFPDKDAIYGKVL